MEGSDKSVKKENCGGGQSRRPLAILLWNAFVISLAISSCASSQSFDVLIVANPDRLVVYDSFQQSLPSLHETVLQPYAPIRVLKSHDVLSDGLTPCAKVEVDGEVFYLLRDGSGQLAGWKNLGTVRTFHRVTLIDDTIAVLASNRVLLQHLVGGDRRFLSVGDRCLRYFHDGGNVYVRLLGSQPEYGWLRLPADGKGKLWRVVQAQAAQLDLSPMIRARVHERIDDANLAYAEVYALLSKESGKRFPVPQWTIDSTNTSMMCVLRPVAAATFYKRTIQALSATLQTYVLGTGYDVRAQGNRIEIRRR
jgi:hypothetical protein